MQGKTDFTIEIYVWNCNMTPSFIEIVGVRPKSNLSLATSIWLLTQNYHMQGKTDFTIEIYAWNCNMTPSFIEIVGVRPK